MLGLVMAKYSAAQMHAMAAKGQAMKNAAGEPSYPIADDDDLDKAIHAVGRGGSDHDAIRKHIIARAKALGLSSRIPDNWNPDGSMSDNGSDGSGRSWDVGLERRFTPGPIEVRAAAEGRKIGGYASVFGALSRNLGGFVELVDTGAFNRARVDGWPNVVCRYNHDPNMVLGTTNGRTLQLRTDNVGLDYEVLPPQSRTDILELVERGDVQFSSFAFRVAAGGDEWRTTDQNYPMRVLHDVELVDVAPVLDPAYPDATAGLRSLAAAKSVPEAEVRSMAAADDLRRLFARSDRPSYRPPKEPVSGHAAMMKLMAKRFGPPLD
jgi:HK97 family phage prohead protease